MANKSTTVKLTLRITSFILRLFLNITFYILVVILIINISKIAYEFSYQLYGPDTVKAAGSGERIIVQIKKGESTMDVASKLENLRAIKNKYSFWLKTKLQNSMIMPGTYEISSDMTYTQILTVITDYSASIIKEEDTGTDQSTPSGTDGSGSDTGTGEGTGSDTGTVNDAGANADNNTNAD